MSVKVLAGSGIAFGLEYMRYHDSCLRLCALFGMQSGQTPEVLRTLLQMEPELFERWRRGEYSLSVRDRQRYEAYAANLRKIAKDTAERHFPAKPSKRRKRNWNRKGSGPFRHRKEASS